MVGALVASAEFAEQRSDGRGGRERAEAILSEGYYVDNLVFLIRHVERQSADLLCGNERAFATEFAALSTDAQRLYVRLISRKGPLFRSDKLSYREITSIVDAETELKVSGFVDDASDADAQALLALLRKPELLTLAAGSLSPSMRRDDVLEYLARQTTPDEVREHLRLKLGASVLRPRRTEALDVFRLLFFGNLDQDLTEFVLDELGITPFERYPVPADARLFRSRECVDHACLLYALRAFAAERLPELNANELCALARMVPVIDEPVTQQRAGRLLVRIGRQLERLAEPEAALDVYRLTDVAPSRERQARLRAAQDQDHEMLGLCQRMLDEPSDESEFEFAVRFAQSRAKKMKYCVPGWPVRHQPRLQRYKLALPPGDHRVEEVARRYYEGQGDQAWYVENRLFPGLFGLAFWDVIFSPVPGAFIHPFQRGPVDLFTPAFGARRRHDIRTRLSELDDEASLADRVCRTYEQCFPRANHFVHWGGLCPELINITLERVPTAHLIAVFTRLLRDPRNNRSGFPDLIVFPPQSGYRLVEVKGPGDTLQANQKRWLSYFDEHDIPADVLDVEWR